MLLARGPPKTDCEINEENFDAILDRTVTSGMDAAAATGAFDFIARSAPFCSAYWRGNITRDQFKKVILQIFPETSARLINRVAMLTLLGPAYGMFLLAGTGFKGALHETPDIPLNKESAVDDKVEPKPEAPKKNKQYSRRDLITLSFLKEFD